MQNVRKQQKKQEMLLQPLDVSEGLNEPLNPIREKQSDLIVNLLSDYDATNREQLEKFLKKFEKPMYSSLKKYAVIGSARDFDQALIKSEIISITNLHRLCSEYQIEPLFLKKEEVDVCIQK